MVETFQKLIFKKKLFMMKIRTWKILAVLLSATTGVPVHSQEKAIAKVAIIQADAMPTEDPFMGDFDMSKVKPLMTAHFDKLLSLFEKAGEEGADIVCGPEDMQHIGSYGLYLNTKDPETGKILFSSLAVPVPGELTNRVAAIAARYHMYVIAPVYEDDGGKIFNTAVVFDREGNIIGKHRKTVLPVMETWLVSEGDDYEVYQTDFGNIAIATCWEMTFPEISSIYALKGADIIFNPTMARDNEPRKSLSTAHTLITRARDNSVYIAPCVLGSDGNGILDFDGKVLAEATGKKDVVVMTAIDFSKERLQNSPWWETINGTGNYKAILLKSRRPETYKMLTEPHPPALRHYDNIHLTTGDREKQLKAVKEVDYGPGKN